MSEDSSPKTVTASERYAHLSTFREPYLKRARDVARVTIPALVPPEGGRRGTDDLEDPFQSVGARGVNTLSAKLLLALFPPGNEYFRLTVDDFVLQQLQEVGEDARAEVEKVLGSISRAVHTRLEQNGIRSRLSEALRQILVTGNVLVRILKKGKMKIYYLQDYVVRRDSDGSPLEIIIREVLDPASLPPRIHEMVTSDPQLTQEDESGEKTVELFTRIVRKPGGSWKIHQEVGEEAKLVPGSEGTFPEDRLPFIPLRYSDIPGEDYSRSFAEEYLGDLNSLEALSKSIVELAAQVARILYFVRDGGLTDPDDVADAPSGAVLNGDANDVTILALEKFAEFRVANETAVRMEQRLEASFLLMSAVQRAGERVTAEEIRRLADELEQSLGGLYSILAEELQRPLARLLIHEMGKEEHFPALPEDTVSYEIVTGMEALGRNRDLMKLQILVQDLAQTFGPEEVRDRINAGSYAQRKANALNIDVDGLLRSDEEVQQIQQQRMQAAMAEKAVGPAMSAAASQPQAAPEE